MNTWFGFNIIDLSNPALYWQTSVLVLFSYLFGSINFGRILSIIKKKSLAEVGSGNFGSTNAGRAFGVSGFLFVFIGDVLKPFFALMIMVSLTGWFEPGLLPSASIPISLLFCVVGHCWPIYFKFKGGKGIATSLGVVLILNWYVGLIATAVVGLAVFFTRRVSASTLIGTLSAAFLFTFSGYPVILGMSFYSLSLPFFSLEWSILVIGWIIFAIVVFTHRKNIKKIMDGTESTIDGVKEARDKFFKIFNGKYSLYSIYFYYKNKKKSSGVILDSNISPGKWRRKTPPTLEKNTTKTKKDDVGIKEDPKK